MRYQNENFNGELDFRSNAHDTWSVESHLHEYSELLFCKSGECLAIVNGTESRLCAGELIFIPPHYVHRYDCPDGEVICAVFSNDLIPLYSKALGGRYYRPAPTEAGALSELLLRFPTLDRRDYLTVSGYLSLILARVMETAAFDKTRQGDGALYQKVISYVAEHYAEELSLASLARQFGYNEKYLSHALHELTGIHFRALVNFYRIGQAKTLLERNKDMTVATVAAECGFGAVNTFNREFRRTQLMTPSEYRRRYAQ